MFVVQRELPKTSKIKNGLDIWETLGVTVVRRDLLFRGTALCLQGK